MGIHSYKGIKHLKGNAQTLGDSFKDVKNEPKLKSEDKVSIKTRRKRKLDNGFEVSEVLNSNVCPLKSEKKVIEEGSKLDKIDENLDISPTKKKKRSRQKKKKSGSKPNNDSHLCCITYLKKWKNDRVNWKFEKVKQIRLISLAYDIDKLPEDMFQLLIEYMQGASENMKKLLVTKANAIVAEMEAWEELTDENKKDTNKPHDVKYERARSIVQIFE